MTNYQKQIVKAVADRGYRDGYTNAQFAARQVAKMYEELRELLDHVWPTGNYQRAGTWEDHAVFAGDLARTWLDRCDANKADITDREAAAEELADVLVVVYSFADALGVDVNELALEKAKADMGRGVRE